MAATAPWRVVVSPHPDDEGQVVPLFRRPASRTVFVTLSQGEATNRRLSMRMAEELHAASSEAAMRSALGVAVSPVALDRLLSWHAFLDSECAWFGIEHSSALEPVDDGLLVGANSVRATLALPDGGLTPEACFEAITSLLVKVGVGADADFAVLLAAFDNPGDPSAAHYSHRDHEAVAATGARLALWNQRASVLVRVPNGSVTARLRSADHERIFQPVTGSFQRAYGWLSPNRSAWSTSADALFGASAEFARFGRARS